MRRWLLALLLLGLSCIDPPETPGTVTGISDGDSFTMIDAEKEEVKVRLAEVDTPEWGQPYFKEARRTLSSLIEGKEVQVIKVDTDRYGRIVGRVYRDSLDVNAEMVKQGAAWVFRKYATDLRLFALEQEAQRARRGIWALPESEQVPPWEWRDLHRQE